MKPRSTPPLTALRQAWPRMLGRWWDHYNGLYLRNVLKRPILEVVDRESPWGRWDRDIRRISLAESHILREPWLEAMDTLRHEMAHQLVDEVLKADDETPHGPAFRSAAERLRCASSRSTASDHEQPPEEEERLLRILKKVLSLASSPNVHEAEAAMIKARELMLRHNVELLELDRSRHFSSRTLGDVKGRHTSCELWLATLLGRFFFVEVLWSWSYAPHRDMDGSILKIYGTPQNLDMAEYVYGYVQGILPALWSRYKEASKVRSDRERQRFYAGVVVGFYRKLESQEQSARQEHALVWKGDPQLKGYVRHLNPRIRTIQREGTRSTQAFHDGVQEGRRLTLHRPISQKGNDATRLLGT